MALVAPMLVGLPAFVEMQVELDLPVMAHPAFAGAGRIAPPLLLGKLFRLLGADATIFPNHGGRFSYSRETCLAIAAAAREPWHGLRPDASRARGRHDASNACPRCSPATATTRCCSSAAGCSPPETSSSSARASSCRRRARARPAASGAP